MLNIYDECISNTNLANFPQFIIYEIEYDTISCIVCTCSSRWLNFFSSWRYVRGFFFQPIVKISFPLLFSLPLPPSLSRSLSLSFIVIHYILSSHFILYAEFIALFCSHNARK